MVDVSDLNQLAERDALNAVLHFGATPCQSACTHVLWGTWTALGAANVLARTGEGAVALREADPDRRQLAAIREAVGDVEELRHQATILRIMRPADGHHERLTALADALGDET